MKIKKMLFFVMIFSVLMSNIVFANEWEWQSTPGHHNQSVLLSKEEVVSEDSVYQYGRGDYLAEGSVRIANMQDGTLEIQAMTLAHMNVDRIRHSIFVDVWDEEDNDWIQVGYWDFQTLKEDVENEELHMLSTTFIITGYEVNQYYRARGLHGVEIYDELEACATETHGVLLTDLWN